MRKKILSASILLAAAAALSGSGIAYAADAPGSGPAASPDPQREMLEDLETLEEEAEPGEYDGYIFKLKDGARDAREAASFEDAGIDEVEWSDGFYTAQDADEIFDCFSPDEIAYIEPDYVVEACDISPQSMTDPNDPYYTGGEQWNLDLLNVRGAWERGLEGQPTDGSSRIVVALVDSGINAAHEDINAAHVLSGYNFVADTSDTGDTYGHGTCCAGEVMATKDNGKGIAGIAPEVYVMPLKIFDERGSSSVSRLVSAIDYAVRRGNVDVINMSLGTANVSSSLQTACEDAANAGILLVAAAGNDGKTTPIYPAAYGCVAGVGSVGTASGHTDVSTFSQRGEDNVFCVAPGYEIISTGAASSDIYQKNNGTSLSAPQVSALAALLKSVYRRIVQDDLQYILSATCTDLGSAGRDADYGYGLVDYRAAVRALTESDSLAVRRGNVYYFSNIIHEGAADTETAYGKADDSVLFGDWDGDGVDTYCVRRGNVYYFRNSLTSGVADEEIIYGRSDDDVLVGDWDGDGRDTLAVRRGRTYYLKNSVSTGVADEEIIYGRETDDVLAGDWDGDGRDTPAVRRGAVYYFQNSFTGGQAEYETVYGRADDVVLVGDWDGNGCDTLSVRRGAIYYFKNSISAGDADRVVAYGKETDEVYAGKWK